MKWQAILSINLVTTVKQTIENKSVVSVKTRHLKKNSRYTGHINIQTNTGEVVHSNSEEFSSFRDQIRFWSPTIQDVPQNYFGVVWMVNRI